MFNNSEIYRQKVMNNVDQLKLNSVSVCTHSNSSLLIENNAVCTPINSVYVTVIL